MSTMWECKIDMLARDYFDEEFRRQSAATTGYFTMSSREENELRQNCYERARQEVE